MGSFLSDSSNQRKLAVALCGFLALFSAKIPLLAEVKPEMLMTLLAVIGGWILQSGAKAAVQAHAEGVQNTALIANATDAVAVFKHLSTGEPLPANLVPAPAGTAPVVMVPPSAAS